MTDSSDKVSMKRVREAARKVAFHLLKTPELEGNLKERFGEEMGAYLFGNLEAMVKTDEEALREKLEQQVKNATAPSEEDMKQAETVYQENFLRKPGRYIPANEPIELNLEKWEQEYGSDFLKGPR